MPVPRIPDRQRATSPGRAQSTFVHYAGMKRPPDTMGHAGKRGSPAAAAGVEETDLDITVYPSEPNVKLETSNRAELIECIKRGESPTWVPNRSVSRTVAPSTPA